MYQDLRQISDGKLYKASDRAPLECNDCKGCALCCKDMDQSIVLDPYDIYLLSNNLGSSFEQLMAEGRIELHVENGLLLPNIKMIPKSLDKKRPPECSFLNSKGRCEIHSFRPGICRLFPLGRNYDSAGLSYFVLKDGCQVNDRADVKISKWLSYESLSEYEAWLIDWHDMRAKIRDIVTNADDDSYRNAILTGFIKLFYMTPYTDDFFEEYKRRAESLQ